MARAIKLINAPAGLFDIDGVLVLKTEYSTQHEDGAITPDCYIVDSGEYFWGGVDSVEERNNLEVAPVDMPTLTPPNEPLTLDSRLTPKMVTCPKGWKGVRGTRFYCPGCKKAVKKGEAYCHKCGQAIVFPIQRYDKENNRIWFDFSDRRPPEGEE